MNKRALLAFLSFYRRWLSPVVHALFPTGCRFRPTCSAYAAEAVAMHGAGRGSWLALRRLMRCHPFGRSGFDPVPMPRPRAQQAVSRADPIADLINPPRPLSAVQRALNEYGYGPVKASGVYDDATRAAITRFEKDHNLPPTGQVTPRFKRELSVATGRPLD